MEPYLSIILLPSYHLFFQCLQNNAWQRHSQTERQLIGLIYLTCCYTGVHPRSFLLSTMYPWVLVQSCFKYFFGSRISECRCFHSFVSVTLVITINVMKYPQIGRFSHNHFSVIQYEQKSIGDVDVHACLLIDYCCVLIFFVC